MGEIQITKTMFNRVRPTPVADNATIYFDLAKDDHVQIEIYDALGRLVHRLISGDLPAGSHQVQLKIKNNNQLPNGVYFITMNASDYPAVKKLVIRR